ncbi:hypothetical protein EWG08_18990 [Salmonella enterica subsp. enterica serovar Reading]|nr:hypothetical protein LFZ28_25025 [Salmonella enterica subsp. enterica serovar Milwaukee str. SA19950795]ECE8818527.1 hypothetical protein [Salmonella enterica subsp. enterica serovar Reading]ECI2685323.1 hypothetical protein [Salmonella enterica subsp. enterica]
MIVLIKYIFMIFLPHKMLIPEVKCTLGISGLLIPVSICRNYIILVVRDAGFKKNRRGMTW